MYYIEDIRRQMRQRLKPGSEQTLITIDPFDGRKKQIKTDMVLVGLYPTYALFEDKNGTKESFLYQDIFFRKERKYAKK